MATYTVTNDDRLVCTGTDITSAGIYNALISNSLGSGHVEVTSGNYDHYHFNKVSIDIGSSASNGNSSIWIAKNEFITIDLTGVDFNIYGQWLVGDTNSDGFSNNGCGIGFTGVNPAASATRNLRIRGNGKVSFKGSKIVSNHAFRIEGDDATIEIIECECRLNQICDNTDNYLNATLRILDTRVNNATAVAVKAFNYATQEISRIKIQSGQYALQLGTPVNTVDIFKDLEINSSTYHIAPNAGDCNVIFINPDFTVLRARFITSSDTTTIAFRYNFKVQDASNVAIENAKVYIVDQNSDVVINAESTDASGLINSHLFNYDGDICLQNSTFAGTAKTDRQNHTRSVYKYGFLPKTDTIAIDQDTKDFISLLPDFSITESNKTTVDSYTEIDTPAKFYDRAASYLEDEFGAYTDFIVTKSGNNIDAGSYDVVVDASAGSAFAINGNTITIKATTFIGDILTDGTATLSNGAEVIGTFKDTTTLPWEIKNVEATSRIQLVNLSKQDTPVVHTEKLDGSAGEFIDVTGSYSGDQISVGNVIRLRVTCVVGATAMLPVELTGVATSTGIAFQVDQKADEVYNLNAINGSEVSKTLNSTDGTLLSDYGDPMGIDIDDSDGTASVKEIYAFFTYSTTTKDGVDEWFNGMTAINQNNYRINVGNADIKIQNVGTNAVVVGGGRLYRDDDKSVLVAGNGPITMDSGAMAINVQPQLEETLNANAKVSSINNNTKLIPSLL